MATFRIARWTMALATVLSLIAQPIGAQVVFGELRAADTDRPISGAFVVLRNAAGTELRRTLTDQAGRYSLDAPGPGLYTLQTAVIGIRSWTSPPFELGAGDTLEYRIELVLRSVRLDSVVVIGEAQCRADPTGGAASMEMWTEVRKALAAVSWTERVDRISYDVLSFRRVLNPGSLRPIRGRASRLSGRSRGSPFLSADPDSLSAHGYVRAASDGWKSYGPDADALLSDAFANDHCFYLRSHPEDSTLIGLGFEPIRGREVSDISGVFWVERRAAGLRSLQFRYERLPWPISSPDIGGEVEFQQMSNGLWIVESWRLRLPELRRIGSPVTGRLEVSQFFETGGIVVQLRDPDGNVVRRAGAGAGAAMNPGPGSIAEAAVVRGVLRGTVADAGTGGPVGGAAVFLVDELDRVHDVAFTSPQGWFVLEAPEEGRFRLNVHRKGYVPSGSELLLLGDDRVVDTETRLVGLPTADPDAAGFRRRRREAITLYGFDAQEMAELGAATVLDVLLSIPGVRGDPHPEHVVYLNSQRCRPEVLIDGVTAASPRFLLAPVKGWISAVEVFLESRDTPQEFIIGMRTAGACGTVAIWTDSLIG